MVFLYPWDYISKSTGPRPSMQNHESHLSDIKVGHGNQIRPVSEKNVYKVGKVNIRGAGFSLKKYHPLFQVHILFNTIHTDSSKQKGVYILKTRK